MIGCKTPAPSFLERAGYSVSAALNDKDAVTFIEAPNTIKLVLMCHSVPEASRVFLVTRIKELKPKAANPDVVQRVRSHGSEG